MPDETGYNGYTNYETWNICLWIDNEEYTFRVIHRRAEQLMNKYASTEGPEARKAAQTAVAEFIETRARNALKRRDPITRDLAPAEYDAINWDEVADGLMVTVEEYWEYQDSFL